VQRPLLTLAVAGLLAAAVAFFILGGGLGGSDEADQAAPPPVHDMEAWGVHVTQRAADGNRWELFAQQAAHDQRVGVTRLQAVRLLLPRAKGPPLEATAREGSVRDSDSRVTLTGDVLLEDPQGYRLRTDYLHYWPREARASTEAAVVLHGPFGEARARGATFWTERREVRLHRRVHTTFTELPSDAP
jgi:LPS export ABC transporter protein LptC